MQYEITVGIKVPGFHFYPDAPSAVHFLQASHRHLFTIRAAFAVEHNNRDLEFFLVQRNMHICLNEAFTTRDCEYLFQDNSCESIAAVVGKRLGIMYPTLKWVSVSEDDENEGKAIFDDNY